MYAGAPPPWHDNNNDNCLVTRMIITVMSLCGISCDDDCISYQYRL